MNFQGELSERYSVASESGSSTDSHAETPENKDGEPLLRFLMFQSQSKIWVYTCAAAESKKKFKKSSSSLALPSEEKIWCRFEVQQPHEHWQEETLLVREPGEMCGHLR